MLNQELIDELGATEAFPETALAEAVAAPEKIADAVLRALERAANGEELANTEENLLFWGLHVLAAARDERVFQPLMRLLRQPPDRIETLFGDTDSISLPRIAASGFDGDIATLHAALTDPSLEETLRMGLFGALAFLTAAGRIDRGNTRGVLERFDRERLAESGDCAWVGWEEAVVRLGLSDLMPRADAARADGRTPTGFNDREWLVETLQHAMAAPHDLEPFTDEHHGYIDDVVAELAWLKLMPEDIVMALDETSDGEDEEGEEDEPDRSNPVPAYYADPVRNPLRHVGRNDPCPCGSGRKFKKCCLGK
jgi:Protein of unknown function (DUF1186)/SEC-C motif